VAFVFSTGVGRLGRVWGFVAVDEVSSGIRKSLGKKGKKHESGKRTVIAQMSGGLALPSTTTPQRGDGFI
jgi:hypothetical protein